MENLTNEKFCKVTTDFINRLLVEMEHIENSIFDDMEAGFKKNIIESQIIGTKELIKKLGFTYEFFKTDENKWRYEVKEKA